MGDIYYCLDCEDYFRWEPVHGPAVPKPHAGHSLCLIDYEVEVCRLLARGLALGRRVAEVLDR